MVLAESALMSYGPDTAVIVALAERRPEDDRDRFRHAGYAVSLGLPPTTFD
jgi:hypothetical protein